MDQSRRARAVGGQALLWGGLTALVIGGLAYTLWPEAVSPASPSPSTPVVTLPTPTQTSEPTPKPLPLADLPTPAASSAAPDIAVVSTPSADSVTFTLTPAAESVGWVSSLDGRSHFNVPNLHAGFFKGHIYYGAIQFDLSAVPSDATLTYAALQLAGLDEQNLRASGSWQLNLLDPAIDALWPELTYERLHEATVEITLSPTLTPADLGRNKVNLFSFDPEQLAILQQHLVRGQVSFRLDGPTSAGDNLFTWDSGYHGEDEGGLKPVLQLGAVLPAAPGYVVVTSTPTPENIITAAAQALSATQIAQTTGTYTPVPANWVTPVIVTPQPTPANAATAAYQAALATAEAILNPTPVSIWTATATPIFTNTRQSNNPNEPVPGYVVVTSTPTPENIITAAAQALSATQIAQTIGTYTPVPANWVTPVIVTPQPTPANSATAAYQAALATAEAILSPTPVSVWTATATPIFILLEDEIATPWATASPTATPQPIPTVLMGKIAFLSNRSGGDKPLSDPLVYVIDPDGSNLAVLTDRTSYDTAIARDSYSADQRFRAFVKDADVWSPQIKPAIFFYDYLYNAEEQITLFGAGIAYDPVWSPTREQIAFVSNDSGNDEIWVINRDGSGALQLTRDRYSWWDKHPSWSPDGSRIVFWSNRTGRRQIWVMNSDGSNLYSLSRTGYDDWDPVWIKYSDPARDPVPNLTK